MNHFTKIYHYINILSLDVVAGSVICSLFFARIFEVTVPKYTLCALAITVWIIYTVDHLKDALIIPQSASSDRHRFHQEKFGIILPIVLLACLVDVKMIWHLKFSVLLYGFVLGIWVAMYLLWQGYLKFLKEIFVASLYTLGIVLPSLAIHPLVLNPLHYILIVQFCMTAFINLLLFSLFDYKTDSLHQQHSFVTWFGYSSARQCILLLGMLNMVGGFWMLFYNTKLNLIILLMNMILLTILVFKNELKFHNYYRMIGDAIFFIPSLYFL